MADVVVRDLDADVIEALEAQARRHRRTLQDEVHRILTEQVRGPRIRRSWRGAEFVARAKRIAAMTPDVPQSNSADLIRDDRDR